MSLDFSKQQMGFWLSRPTKTLIPMLSLLISQTGWLRRTVFLGIAAKSPFTREILPPLRRQPGGSIGYPAMVSTLPSLAWNLP
jgi:hypothetical protein